MKINMREMKFNNTRSVIAMREKCWSSFTSSFFSSIKFEFWNEIQNFSEIKAFESIAIVNCDIFFVCRNFYFCSMFEKKKKNRDTWGYEICVLFVAKIFFSHIFTFSRTKKKRSFFRGCLICSFKCILQLTTYKCFFLFLFSSFSSLSILLRQFHNS